MREEGVMFDEERSEMIGGAEVRVAVATHGGRPEQQTWREVDRALRACARKRGELDAEEARWLVAAERLQIHRQLGCASIHEYLERRLGYGPRAARDRLRVARALDELPAMTAALARGELVSLGGARADPRRDARHRGGVDRRRAGSLLARDRGRGVRPRARRSARRSR